MQYTTSDLKKGLKIELNGKPYNIIEYQFVKPGKGNAFARIKIKNLIDGSVLDKTCKIGDKLNSCDVEESTMQFLYSEGDSFTFMDSTTYEQFTLDKQAVGGWQWLTENTNVKVILYNSQIVSVELPNFCVQEVVKCERGVKGNRVANATKPATLRSNVEIQVPLFVNEGDKIKIDTRTGQYVERA